MPNHRPNGAQTYPIKRTNGPPAAPLRRKQRSRNQRGQSNRGSAIATSEMSPAQIAAQQQIT